MQGMWVWSLVGELRSHMLSDMAKKKKRLARIKINWAIRDPLYSSYPEMPFIKQQKQNYIQYLIKTYNGK